MNNLRPMLITLTVIFGMLLLVCYGTNEYIQFKETESIKYELDVTKRANQLVRDIQMGTAWDKDDYYKDAVMLACERHKIDTTACEGVNRDEYSLFKQLEETLPKTGASID